jgi:hypothetical protein
MTRRRGYTAPAAVLAFVAFAAVACDVSVHRAEPSASSAGGASRVPARSASGAPPPSGPAGSTTAARTLARLCRAPKVRRASTPKAAGITPPAIGEVERQISEVRGLRFEEPVPVEPVTPAEMSRRVRASVERSSPSGMDDRRSHAWQTIGVIPPGTTIRDALGRLAAGQVVGYYVPETGRLVFDGSRHPGALERFTLSHELTHALDDQHFHLERADALATRCRDEPSTAALGAIEGSAMFFSVEYAQQFFSSADLASVAAGAIAAPTTDGIPEFLVRMMLWPYTAGETFIAALDARGGTSAVDRALRRLPISTEQVMHPEAYPGDRPVRVDVPDYGPALGKAWSDLDVMQVGEAWLQIMLGLRLDPSTVSTAAAGWGGGIYRAWSRGDRTAVVLATTWDTVRDADEFASAAREWIDRGRIPAVVHALGDDVSVGFATDGATLASLQALL